MSSYKGHHIELAILVDGERLHFDQNPDGKFFLHAYAHDPADSPIELARKWIDYEAKVDEVT